MNNRVVEIVELLQSENLSNEERIKLLEEEKKYLKIILKTKKQCLTYNKV